MVKVLPFLSDANVERRWIDNDDGTYTISETQNLAPLLERNKQIRNSHDGYTPTRDMQFIGTIPDYIHAEFMAKGINLYHPQFEPELRRYLNDPDYRGFRTGEGYIGPKHRHI